MVTWGNVLLAKKLLLRKGEKHLGGNSQNFLGKFVRFFVALRCFYGVVILRK